MPQLQRDFLHLEALEAAKSTVWKSWSAFLFTDWVFGPRTKAGDAERGREEDRVRLDEERAGIHRAPSSHSIQPSLHHISMSLCQPLLLLHSVFKMVLPALFAAVEKQSVDNYHSV